MYGIDCIYDMKADFLETITCSGKITREQALVAIVVIVANVIKFRKI